MFKMVYQNLKKVIGYRSKGFEADKWYLELQTLNINNIFELLPCFVMN